MKGLDPDKELLLAQGIEGRTLDEEQLVGMMTDDVALVWLPSVLFTSGQLLDMAYLTQKPTSAGS
jgi:kynureninase